MKNTKVEILFDDIREYIKMLEETISNKNNEILIKDKRIKAFEEISKGAKDKNLKKTDEIKISKELLDIKSIYYILAKAVDKKNVQVIKELLEIVSKEDIYRLSSKNYKIIIEALAVYSMYSFDDREEKRIILANNLIKFDPLKFEDLSRKVFIDIINPFRLYDFMDEDFLIKYIRTVGFSRDKDIAKHIIIEILASDRVIKGESNIQTLLLLGLHLNIEKVRKVSYMEKLYIKAMDSRYDNLFINYLIGKLKLDYSVLDEKIMAMKVLNKNLVKYIWDIVSLEKIDKTGMTSDEVFEVNKAKFKKVDNIIKNEEATFEKKVKNGNSNEIKAVYLNKNTRVCDGDGEKLTNIIGDIIYYDEMWKKQGVIKEGILYCKTCKKKIINADIIRKIYRVIDSNYKLKFNNRKEINLGAFKYGVSMPRGERFKLLTEVICNAIGVKETIKLLNELIESSVAAGNGEKSTTVLECRYDIERLNNLK